MTTGRRRFWSANRCDVRRQFLSTIADLLSASCVLFLCLLLAACGDDDAVPAQPPAAVFEAAACVMPLPAGQDPANVQCGFVTVPEDRRRPEAGSVRLAVAVL